MKKLICTFVLILAALEVGVSAKPWNGIVPCVSTRFDAEKILGKDLDQNAEIGFYRYRRSRIHIYYSPRLKDAPSNDIVERIDVYPEKPILLRKYIKTISDFPRKFLKKEMDPKKSHIGYLAFYMNEAEGFDITVQKNEKGAEIIDSLSYYAPERTCAKLPAVSTMPA